MVAPLQPELVIWGLLTLCSLSQAQSRSGSCSRALQAPPALRCPVQSQAGLLLLCSGSLWGPAGRSTGEDTGRQEGRRDLHLPVYPLSQQQPCTPQHLSSQEQTKPRESCCLASFRTSRISHLTSLRRSWGPTAGSCEDPPGLSSSPAGLPAAASQLLLLRFLCSLVIFLALQWLFNQLSTFKISQFT